MVFLNLKITRRKIRFTNLSHKSIIASRFVAEITTRICSLITFPTIARHLSTEGYGINTQLSTLVNFIAPLMTLGLGYSAIKYLSHETYSAKISSNFLKITAIVAAVSGVSSLIFYFFSSTLDHFFFKNVNASNLIKMSSILVLFGSLELIILDFYRSRMMIVQASILQILQAVGTAAGTVIILKSGFDLEQLIVFFVLAKFVFLVTSFIFFIKKYSFKDLDFKNTLPYREAILFGLPLLVAGLANWILHLSDRLVLGWYLDIDSVGQYGLSYTLATMIAGLGSPFWNPLYPQIAKLKSEGNIEAIKSLCKQYNTLFFLIAFPAATGLIAVSQSLVEVLGTRDFVISPLVFAFIVGGVLSDQVASCAHYIVNLFRSSSIILWAAIVGGALNIVLNIALVPALGIMGAAIATLVSFMVYDTILYFSCFSLGFKVSEMYSVPESFKIFTASLIMAVVVHWSKGLELVGVLKLIALVLMGMAIYIALLMLIFGKRHLISLTERQGYSLDREKASGEN